VVRNKKVAAKSCSSNIKLGILPHKSIAAELNHHDI
jgi:hypothetical protein